METNGVRLRVIEAGQRGSPVILLAHGFPELAYSWRHQIPVLAQAGYHVLAPDQRGYGGSDRPEAVEDYDIHALTGDLIGLLDVVGAQQAIFVGHDWGAMVVWQAALLHPGRVRAVAGLSVPPIPRARSRPTERWRQKFGDDFYMLRFQEPGLAEHQPLLREQRSADGPLPLGRDRYLRGPGDRAARLLRHGPQELVR